MRDAIRTIDLLIRRERYRAAEKALDEHLALVGIEPALELHRARLQVARGGVALDEVILRLEDLLACAAGLDGVRRDHAIELVAAAYVRKRLPSLAREMVARGRAAGADRPGFHALEAEIALLEDDRAAARAAFERALATDPAPGRAHLGFGQLLYLMADFAAAEAQLRRVPLESRHWGAAMRVRAAIAAAGGEHERESQIWRALLDCRPDGDNAQADHIGLGLCLSALGRRAAALDSFQAAWQMAPDTMDGRSARERMTHLEAAPSAAARVELHAFPTTTPRSKSCGPAVLELVLRYFDFSPDPDAFPDAALRGSGTRMFEIVEGLARMGLEARRVEVNAARIKRAIDLGCPVIVHEEHWTSSHVAVMTGYDDALGVFVAQAPVRHPPMFGSFTFTQAAGDGFGNGAILVLGPEGEAAARRASCDEAGLVERRHLALIDDCSRRVRRKRGEGHEDLAPGEVVSLCEEVLALVPDFGPARFLRLRALRQLAEAGKVGEDNLLRELAAERSRHAGDAWPYQLHASLLLARGRYDEAFVAYLDAYRRGRHDETNLQRMGEARWLAGDLASAERYFMQTLTDAPDAAGAAGYVAAVYLRAIEELDVAAESAAGERESEGVSGGAREDEATKTETMPVMKLYEIDGPDRAAEGAERDTEPDAPAASEEGDDAETDAGRVACERAARMPPRMLRTRPAHGRTELIRRGRHFSRVALAAAPEDPFNQLVAGELARRGGKLPDAAMALRRRLDSEPERHAARRSLAAVLERLGETQAAERELCELVRRSSVADAHAALAQFLRRRGRDGDAAVALRSAIERVRGGREKLVQPLYSVLEQLGGSEAAAGRLRAVAERHLGDDAFLREVVSTLDHEGQLGHALALAHHLVERSPDDPDAVWQLARLLDDSGVHRTEALAWFEHLVELAPDLAAARVRLAWLLLASDPAAALAVLEPGVAAAEDSEFHDVRSACLHALGRTNEAEGVLTRALHAAPAPAVGLAMLIGRHCTSARYDRAVLLAARLDLAALGDLDRSGRELVESCWLTAYRLSGRAREVLPRVRAMCAPGVPPHLAFEIYFSYRTIDRELAARAAEVRAGGLDDAAERAEWRAIATGLRARLTGDASQLDSLARRMPPHAGAWAQLSFSYDRLERYADADAAAARAYGLDPLASDAFTAMIESLERQSRIDEAIVCAEAFAAARPYEHQGPERLAILLAKVGRVEEALGLSARAAEAAPHCHLSQQSRALALFMSGDYGGALDCARRVGGNEPSAADSSGASDHELLIAALTGDLVELERGLEGLERRTPAVYPLYRERLRLAATARAARP